MARLWQCGFETNSLGANQEVSGPLTAAGLISTTVKHAGAYSAIISSPTSGQAKGHYYQYRASEAADHLFFRTYIQYTGSLPASENRIMLWNDTTALTTPGIYITIDANGALRLYDEDGAIGSASSNLAADTWYRFELEYDTTLGSNNHVVTARIAAGEETATTFATSSTRFIAGTNQPYYWLFGLNLNSEAQTAGTLYFDDMAINDATGSVENSWPGAGFIVHLQPNATGDNGDWTNDYTAIDEITPDSGSTYINSNTLNQIEDVNVTATPAAIASDATIKVVAVGVHYAGASSSANASFQLRLKDSSAGTVSSGTAITPAGTGYRNNANANPTHYTLVSYTRPGGSNAWTKAYLDTAQIGVICSTGNTNAARVSTLWLSIEYSAPPPPIISLAKGVITAQGNVLTLVKGAKTTQLAKGIITAQGNTLTVNVTQAGILISLAKGSIQASGLALTLLKGSKSTLLNKASISVTGNVIDLIPGSITVTLDVANISATGLPLSLSLATRVLLAKALISTSGKNISVIPGAKNTSLSKGTISIVGNTLTVIPGTITILLHKGNLSVTGNVLDQISGSITIPLDKASITVLGEIIDVVPGAMSIVLDPAIVTILGKNIGVIAPAPGSNIIPLNKAVITALGKILDLIPGSISIPLDLGTITLAGKPTSVRTTTIVTLDVAKLTALGKTISVLQPSVIIALDAAAITTLGKNLTVIPGPIGVPLDAAVITALGNALRAFIGTVIPLQVAEIMASGRVLTVQPGAITIPLDAATILAGLNTLDVHIEFLKILEGDVTITLMLMGDVVIGITFTRDVTVTTKLEGDVQL